MALYYVDPVNGNNANTGLSAGQAWKTWAYASANMAEGDGVIGIGTTADVPPDTAGGQATFTGFSVIQNLRINANTTLAGMGGAPVQLQEGAADQSYTLNGANISEAGSENASVYCSFLNYSVSIANATITGGFDNGGLLTTAGVLTLYTFGNVSLDTVTITATAATGQATWFEDSHLANIEDCTISGYFGIAGSAGSSMSGGEWNVTGSTITTTASDTFGNELGGSPGSYSLLNNRFVANHGAGTQTIILFDPATTNNGGAANWTFQGNYIGNPNVLNCVALKWTRYGPGVETTPTIVFGQDGLIDHIALAGDGSSATVAINIDYVDATITGTIRASADEFIRLTNGGTATVSGLTLICNEADSIRGGLLPGRLDWRSTGTLDNTAANLNLTNTAIRAYRDLVIVDAGPNTVTTTGATLTVYAPARYDRGAAAGAVSMSPTTIIRDRRRGGRRALPGGILRGKYG